MFNVRLAGGHLYGKQLFTWLSLMVSLMASFVLSFFPLDVLGEIWDLIESVSYLLYCVQVRCISIKFRHKLLLFYMLSLIICESVGKIIARTICFMHQGIFRPIYILLMMLIFSLLFRTKIPFELFNLNPF